MLYNILVNTQLRSTLLARHMSVNVVRTRAEYRMGVVVSLKKLKPPTVLRMLSKDLNGAERSPHGDGDLPMSRLWVIFFGSKVERARRLPFNMKWNRLMSPSLELQSGHTPNL